ncbi:MAG TPA: NAD(P)H:quinone oxidoreductase [Nocardioidaceae bacterium]|nr:NAD(P)H:quinone oxidoreductase [Nocardioidaceae bacterium]
MVNIAVLFYSSSGTNHETAQAVADGAAKAGAEVRVRRIGETAPRAAIEANPQWKQWVDEVAPTIEEATLDDLEWGHGVAFGTPTRFGNASSQMRSFIDTTGGLWAEGKLADKTYTAFTSAMNPHGGNETTLLSLYTTFYHWGGVVVAPGYTDPVVFAAGGNPYGTSHATTQRNNPPGDEVLEAARHQGYRLADVTARLHA